MFMKMGSFFYGGCVIKKG